MHGDGVLDKGKSTPDEKRIVDVRNLAHLLGYEGDHQAEILLNVASYFNLLGRIVEAKNQYYAELEQQPQSGDQLTNRVTYVNFLIKQARQAKSDLEKWGDCIPEITLRQIKMRVLKSVGDNV